MTPSQHRRPPFAIWALVVFVLIAAASVAIWRSHTGRGRAIVASTPVQVSPGGAVEPPSHVVHSALPGERSTVASAPRPPGPPPPPLPAGMEPRAVAARYRDFNARAAASTNTLRGLFDSNPAKYKYVRWKLQEAGGAIFPLAVIQAIGDPTLRPIFTEKLLNPTEFQSIVDWLTESGMDAGQLAGIATPEDALAALAARERFFEGRYRESLRRLGIPREVSALLSDSAGAGWLRINVSEYMQNHGYFYDPQAEAFVPGDGGPASAAVSGTFFSIGRDAD